MKQPITSRIAFGVAGLFVIVGVLLAVLTDNSGSDSFGLAVDFLLLGWVLQLLHERDARLGSTT